jgi:hypothetical protein
MPYATTGMSCYGSIQNKSATGVSLIQANWIYTVHTPTALRTSEISMKIKQFY